MSHPSSGYVFISYSRRDGDAMQRIVSFLRGQDVNAWVDNERLVPGTPIWEREIERAIKGAVAVVVVLSPDAKESVWVLNELTLADEYRKRVFPVLVAGDFRDSVPFRLATRQFVDLRANESIGLNALTIAIRRYLDELERLEAERLAAGQEAVQSEAEKKSRDDAARMAEWRAEENQRAEQRAREAAERLAAQKSEQERLPPITLAKGQRPVLQKSIPAQNESIKPPSTHTSTALPFSRPLVTWAVVGALTLCGLSASVWGIYSWLQNAIRPTATEQSNPGITAVVPTEATEEPTQEPDPTEDPSLPPFSGSALVAPDCDYGGVIQSIEATDRYTVTFNLCKPEPIFLNKLALSVFGIYPEEWIAATAGSGARTSDGLTRPIGTGPYMVDSWKKGQNITFKANPNYWGAAPNTNTLLFLWAESSSDRVRALQSSSVDGITDTGLDEYSTIVNDKSLSLKVRPSTNVFYIGINNNTPPFNDPRVRQALAMGIDRQRIVDLYYPPGSEVASHLMPCTAPDACLGESWYEYDPEKARQLLAEAGYPDGFTTNLYYRDVVRIYLPSATNVVQEVQSQLQQNLGIQVIPVPLDSAAFFSALDDSALDGLYFAGWVPTIPRFNLFMGSIFIPTNRQFGDTPYTTINTLVEEAAAAHPAQAASLYAQVNNAIRADVPLIPVAHGITYLAYRADVDGQPASPMHQERFASVRPNGRDTFTWMDITEPISLFCADELDSSSLRACAQFMETLYVYQDGSGDVEPLLAKSCEPNQDLTVWVCTLQQNVLFHDGTTLDANDVVATFTMGLDASSPLHAGNANTWEYYNAYWGVIP